MTSSFASSRPRLRRKVKHILFSTMLCCGKRKDGRGGDTVEALMTEEGGVVRRVRLRTHPQHHVVVGRDFRKVSGISNEIFRQLEAVENDFDAATAAHLDRVENRGGEMLIRMFDPHALGRVGSEAQRKYGALADSSHVVRFVEIIKRPGQTLGLYIREGDGLRETEGVFISRIALESAVYNSGLLRVGDEIVAVNLVEVRRGMGLDDVVIVMSIPRRLVLTIRSRICSGGTRARELTRRPQEGRPPVVVIKKETLDDRSNGENSENGHLIRARTKGLPPEIPAIAVKLSEKDHQREAKRYEQPHCPPGDDTYYSRTTSTTIPHHHHPYHHPPPSHQQYTANRRREEPVQSTPRWVVTEQPKVQYHQKPYQDPSMSYEPQKTYHQDSYIEPQKTSSMSYEPKTYQDSYIEPHHQSYQEPLRYDHTYDRHRRPDTTYDRSYEPKSYDNKGYEPPRYEAHHRRTRSMVPPTRGGAGYYDIAASTPLRRSTGMLRSECSGIGDYQTTPREEYRRRSFRVSPTMHHRGRLRRYGGGGAGTSPSDGILRRHRGGGDFFESASDTEAQETTRWTMGGRRGQSYGGRSQSLPRCLRGRGAPQAVRFSTYDSQEESDGALSAPEMSATRSLRRPVPSSSGGLSRGREGGVFTSNEYRAWMSRAPSTSAIYETLRRGQRGQRRTPALGRVAYSAESLLDTVRQEEYRGIYTFPRRLQTPSEDESSLLGGGTRRGGFGVPNPTPVKASEDRMHLVSLDPRDFNKYRARPTITPVTSLAPGGPPKGHSGLLWVHLLSGRGLRTTGGGHFRDLYCVIEVDRVHKARTVVRTGEHSFDWDEIFEIDLVENREVAFLLYTWDPRFRHKLCYKGVLHLSALLRESPVHSLALKLEPRGTLYLKLRYRSPAQTFQRASDGAGGVFGVDIETLLVREDSGFGVPLIVKRCTEEVERRGLDIVGLYRLCGSALRKRILRDEFERSALAADLSVEHVPDINVITSLLKDYLRELPEPLLSRSLYDMLVDGLSVCLPDDPEGSAKLMFSILECLPKSNLCTVLLLLDHLRLVASHADRNKMGAQGLAAAFGPALMCHADGPSAAVDIRRPIDIVRFLVEMWPDKRTSWSSSGSGSWDSTVLSELLESLESAWLGRQQKQLQLPESLVEHVP